MMLGYQRMLCRAAATAPYRPAASARFNRLVVARKSWSYGFCARVAGLTTRRFR